MTEMNAETTANERMVRAGNLAGVKELALILGLGERRTTISNWSARRDQTGFPEPVAELASGPVYDSDEVLEWYRGWNPTHGPASGRQKNIPGEDVSDAA